MRRAFALLAALLLAPHVAAQGARVGFDSAVSRWPLGERVRIHTVSGEQVVGLLVDEYRDTLTIGKPHSIFRTGRRVSPDSIVRFERSRGPRVSARRVVVGAAAGAAAGLLYATLMQKSVNECPFGPCEEVPPRYGRLVAMGAGFGAAVGAVLFVERWEEVAIPARAGAAVGSRGVSLALALSFR